MKSSCRSRSPHQVRPSLSVQVDEGVVVALVIVVDVADAVASAVAEVHPEGDAEGSEADQEEARAALVVVLASDEEHPGAEVVALDEDEVHKCRVLRGMGDRAFWSFVSCI